jgi:hypothetical protein
MKTAIPSSAPDYATARQKAGFAWHVGVAPGAYMALTGVPIRDYFLDPAACIEIYRKGRPLAREMFGEEVILAGPSTPAISYGHVNGLGSELCFPEGGEVAHTPIHGSLEEGIAALGTPVDFARAGMTPFYLDFRRRLQEAFPGENVGFSFALQGPITTAWELRGHEMFTDLMEYPDLMEEYLRKVTDSIAAYHHFRCGVLSLPVISPERAGMTDDVAAMVPPKLWGRLVLPAWERYYRAMTTGLRHAHVEDLRPIQLPFLEEIGLGKYDPSISPKLTPQLVAEGCRVPFMWRLGSFRYREMTEQDVEAFVFDAVAGGASEVFTVAAAEICHAEGAVKVRAFIRAAKEAKQHLDADADRRSLAVGRTGSLSAC